MLHFKEALPLSIYIHLPWCVRKCPYCDFNSHAVATDELPEQAYVEALIKDLEYELPRIWGRSVQSIFIGGGTPSLFSGAALGQLLSALDARLKLHPDLEITLEANPGTAEAQNFKDYRAIGINRLSIGVQSFHDDKLKVLGRIHSANEALQAIRMAKAAGFENINIDLMFGLPDQTIDAALEELQTGMEQEPTHISWYQLTIEPNTIYYSHPPTLPADDHIWEMQQQGQTLLNERGFKQYEISAYARGAKQCKHNLNYWQFGDYLGLGAGAHSKITNVAEDRIERLVRHRLPNRYMELAGKAEVLVEQKTVAEADLPLEFFMNALRLNAGVDTRLFNERTGLSLDDIAPKLDELMQLDLIEWSNDVIKPTPKGHQYLNDVLQRFLPTGLLSIQHPGVAESELHAAEGHT